MRTNTLRSKAEFLNSEMLTIAGGTKHAFFSRKGGVSKGVYSSLNCGFGSSDKMTCILENRSRAARVLGLQADQIHTLTQVHGTDVVKIGTEKFDTTFFKADALVTDRPGIALGIVTADCAPVLFFDPTSGVIGAAHAGWRGALNGIINTTLSAMCSLGAKANSILATIGPCIGPNSYEVGPEFPDLFIYTDKKNQRFFRKSFGQNGFIFDLPGYITAQLEAFGLRSISNMDEDTLGNREYFFSYRRAFQNCEQDCGRNLSIIMLNDP